MANFAPKNQEVVQVNSRVSGTGALNASLNGINGGRPPDSARPVVVPSRLERLANPVNEEDQQAVKRSHGESDEVIDIGVEEIIAAPKNGLRDGVENDGNGEKGEIQQGGDAHAKLSFRDMLIGQSIGAHAASTIPELDVEATESSFAVLADDTDDHTPRVGDADPVAADASDVLLADPKNITIVVIEMNGSEKRVLLHGSGSEDSSKNLFHREHGGSSVVASKDVVVQEPVTVKAGTHVAVRVVKRGADLGSKTGEDRRSISGLKDGVTKGNLKVGISKKGDREGGPARTKQPSRQSGKICLDEWVGSFDRELEDSVRGSIQHSLGSNQQVTETVDVQWRENDSFVCNLK
ncbi:hypothetical protein V6N11_051200 [Hibiscus sabdariffa]|uniref:Uncharacterized protein n=1 Tax=Hibiscus sabdariffa TaxID=183260 RepID=A0ABR2N8P0_9ROSI